MENKDIKKQFTSIKNHLMKNCSTESLVAISEELEKQFNTMNEIINENEEKKAELEKNYSNEMQELME